MPGDIQTKRHILHLDLDAFFVSVERLLHPELNGLPVIIGGESLSNRGVVSACSYEARKYGVHSAMPIAMARKLCPEGTFVRGTYDAYGKYSGIVTEIVSERSPLFEKASVDEFYVDLTGMDRFYGTLKWSEELKKCIVKETGLPVSFGLSVNKTVSKIATDYCKPNGQIRVPGEEVLPFLGALTVDKIPGVGKQTQKELNELGIQQVRQLQQIPPDLLTRAFGKWGHTLWQKAQGIDDAPVVAYREEKSISREQTLQEDTTDPAFLNVLLTRMADELAYELRSTGRLSAHISIKIRYSDFETHTKGQQVNPTANEQEMSVVARKLLKAVFTRRVRVRLIGMKLSNLCPGYIQTDLFQDTGPGLELRAATDRIRNRYGKHVIGWAAGFIPED